MLATLAAAADVCLRYPVPIGILLGLLLDELLFAPHEPRRAMTNHDLLATCLRAWPDFTIEFVMFKDLGPACIATCTKHGRAYELATMLSAGAPRDYIYRRVLEASAEQARAFLRLPVHRTM